MMQSKRFIQILLATALVACLVPAAAFGAESPGAIGEVVYLTGSVTARQQNGQSRDLALKKPVLAGDVIVTGAKSNVEIVLKDDSVFSQGPDASISLDEFVFTGQRSASKLLFKMGRGTFRYVTGQIVKQNPDGFAIQTPTTTIGIRGTEVFATITPERERIGNLSLTAGHTMSVGPQQITRSMYAVSADPRTGSVSAPEPVSADEARAVIRIAPQTTQGEVGTTNQDTDDMSGKVDSIENAILDTKRDLSTGKPHYHDLHILTLQQTAHGYAEQDANKAKQSSRGTESGGAGDGGGGGGGGHP